MRFHTPRQILHGQVLVEAQLLLDELDLLLGKLDLSITDVERERIRAKPRENENKDSRSDQ